MHTLFGAEYNVEDGTDVAVAHGCAPGLSNKIHAYPTASAVG